MNIIKDSKGDWTLFCIGIVFSVILSVALHLINEVGIKLLPFFSNWKLIGLVIATIYAVIFLRKKSNYRIRILSVLLFGIFLGINLYDTFSSDEERIAILLPWTNVSDATRDDGKLQLEGIMDFIMNNDSICKDFKFVFLDHQNNKDTALTKVKDELKFGTKYFFATMSAVNEYLSNQFITNKDLSERILVCAVTSTPNIKTQQNHVYRYYIRSQEEGEKLATIEGGNVKKAVAIVVNDNYGIGAANSFKKTWEKKHGKDNYYHTFEIPNETDVDVDTIQKSIHSHIDQIPQGQRVIFICHYGEGIYNIVKALDKLNILDDNTTLLFTSTITHNRWMNAVKRVFTDKNPEYSKKHYYTEPDYKTDFGQIQKIDDVKDFSKFAIEKLIRSIGEKNFNDNWWEIDVPPQNQLNVISVKDDNKADLNIPMVIQQIKFTEE